MIPGTWLAGAFSSGRIRVCQTGPLAGALGCQGLFNFSEKQSRAGILVGADQLEKQGEYLFKLISMNPSSGSRKGAEESFVPQMTIAAFPGVGCGFAVCVGVGYIWESGSG
jgi:hypothetical protein